MQISNAIAYRNRFQRSLGLTATLARGLLGSPTRLPEYARVAAGAILDQQFRDGSPIPLLEDDVVQAIMSHGTTIPPLTSKIPGNQSVPGLVFLVTLAKANQTRCAFEIGTFNGLTAFALAKNLPDATVHTLDIPAEAQTELELERTDYANRIHFERLAYAGSPEESRIVQHWSDSASFGYEPWYGHCDLVYIDGSHSFAYVKSDSENAFKLLSPHGIVVWDDYWWRVAGVREYLNSLKDVELRRLPGTRLVVHIPEGSRNRILSRTSFP
jgi:predicted O-methyltransferase YrrM